MVEEHLGNVLGPATGPAGELMREVAHQVGWVQPCSENAVEPDMNILWASYAPIVGADDDAPLPMWTSGEIFIGVVV